MKIPIYEARLIEDEELGELGLSCISLVDFPAMEKDMMVFSGQRKPVMFAVQDEMQHKITSVAIRCGYPIYRIDENGMEYYIRFGREVIDQLAERYSKNGLLNQVSVMHNGELLDGIVMTEFYIKNVEKGINPVGFEDIEDYSLMCTFKVNNDEVWNRIMEGEFGGLSVEVMLDVEPTQEYVETTAEDDFLAELVEWLTGGEKKKFRVDRSDILSAIERGRTVMIDEGGDKAVEYWPFSVGKKDGKDVVILYNPTTGKWDLRTIKDIKDMVVTKDPVGDFTYTDPSYGRIIEDDDVVVSKTVHSGSFSDLIHNRVVCMLTYNDEQPDPATGYRQVAVIAHGYTEAGNECLRIMQVFGDSRSAREGDGVIPDYRLILTKRIQSLKPMTGTAPWGWDILDSRVNLEGDRSMRPCLTHITREDLDR